MLEFAWPWMLLALLLPLLARRWLPPAALPRGAALQAPLPELHALSEVSVTGGSRVVWARRALLLTCWLLLVLAACRPQWLGEPQALPVSGRDLLLAVDVSGSMSEEDFVLDGERMNRLEAVKHVAGEFIQRRIGDRVGLILFGDRPYVQTPLTFDRSTARHLLEEAAVGLAGKATALGDAIGLAIKRLRERPREQRVLVLLTDGRHTAGVARPYEAARVAAREGIRIHTIGVGSAPAGGSLFSGLLNRSSDLDEPALRQIAGETGGRYFRARDADELAEIYAEIDALEPLPGEAEVFRPLAELFHWPLGLALLLSVWLARRIARGSL